jgi:uncharacterized protein with HEPN domain
MKERDRLFLSHILEAISAIESFTTEGRAQFMLDLKTQSAVVRQIEIVGEAVKNLSAELVAQETDVPWRLIAGTRDRLIHKYFRVDLDAVWSMVEQDLPTLKKHVRRLRGEN